MDYVLAIEKYKKDTIPKIKKTKEYYEDLSLEKAIMNASQGINPNINCKMDSHQRRIGYKKCKKGAGELIKNEMAIDSCRTFEELFEITEKVKKEIFGLGNLWSYDTALRIGFRLKLYPKEIYVQCGVIDGIKRFLPSYKLKNRSVPLGIFPKEIQSLKSYEAENFFCLWGKLNDSAL